MEAILTVIAITILGVAAAIWGNDSRDGRDWEPRPEYWAFPRRTPFPRETRQPVRHPEHHATTEARSVTAGSAEACQPAL